MSDKSKSASLSGVLEVSEREKEVLRILVDAAAIMAAWHSEHKEVYQELAKVRYKIGWPKNPVLSMQVALDALKLSD